MFNYFAESLKQLNPRAFVAENVDDLTFENNRKKLEEILKSFTDCGYTVYHSILNANDYGSATKRKRLIIIGIRDDCNITPFSYPEPNPYKKNIKDVIPNTSDLRIGKVSEGISGLFKLIPNGGSYRDILLKDLNEYIRNKSGKVFDFKIKTIQKLKWDSPCGTLTTRLNRSPYIVHPEEPRILNVGEASAIQGFPNKWFKHVPFTQAYKQIGNSVPPDLAYAVMDSVKKYLEGH
jgi:DNA (cytosine-5)-methyltransferase 1